MFRFQQALRDVKTISEPLSEVQLKVFAASRFAEDIPDILAWMERLSDEKAALPVWDGDSSDDISKAQLELARLLVLLVRKFGLDFDGIVSTAGEETRRWLSVARDMQAFAEPFWQKLLRRLLGRRN